MGAVLLRLRVETQVLKVAGSAVPEAAMQAAHPLPEAVPLPVPVAVEPTPAAVEPVPVAVANAASSGGESVRADL